MNTGENIGSGIGSDGSPNGIINSVVIGSANLTNVNFGIEQLPASDNKSYTIVAPLLNSMLALNGTGLVPGPLTGSDPEDGTLSSSKKLIIKTVPTNSQLYYNGTLITNNTTISNYNPAKLSMKFTTLSVLNTSFQYAYTDAANNQSIASATYFISWTSTLPVTLADFSAKKENDYAVLNWTTSSELNTKAFNIERSTDNGKTWQSIGEVIAKGNSNTKQFYSYTDDNPQSGVNLYRLQIEDNNGSTHYSEVSQVSIQSEGSMSVYPNPVGEEEALNIQLAGLTSGQYKIAMVSTSGQVMKQMSFNVTKSGSALLVIPTGSFPRGTYIVTVNGNGQQYTKTVVVENR